MSGARLVGNAAQISVVEAVMFRWGGGAAPGKWHVFLVGLSTHDWWVPGVDCVVDDFGTLVRVPE